jgi:hypothetical protein
LKNEFSSHIILSKVTYSRSKSQIQLLDFRFEVNSTMIPNVG